MHYQLMKLVDEGKLNKVGTYYVPRKIGWVAFRSLMSYARRFIKKFENYGSSLFKTTLNHTKRFYLMALSLISG